MRRLLCLLCLLIALSASTAWAIPVRVLTTGDTHGWISAQQSEDRILGGTAEMLSYWRAQERYVPSKFLVISAGDNATGPAITTAFRGDPAIAVMNLMGYDVSAVGNHEFDFMVDKLMDWTKAAKFPFIASNITTKDGKPAPFALPYVFNTEQGVKIAIVGLTTTELQKSTNNAKAYIVSNYADALRPAVKAAREQGAQMVIVAAHVPQEELVKLADEVKDLKIPLMIGGHSHELAQRMQGDTWVINSGLWWDSYTRIDLDYNPKTGKTIVLSSKQVWLSQVKPAADRAVAKEVSNWQKKMDTEYGTVMGYTAAGLTRIPTLYNFVADAYAAFDTTADFAILNYGSLRQDIPAGELTKGTIFSLMPFTNTFLKVKLTGSQLSEFLAKAGDLGVSGLRRENKNWLISKTGAAIDPVANYVVVMPNFIYETTPSLMEADPSAVMLSDDWRVPVYKWLEKHPTSKDKPLETLIDGKLRI